MIPISVMQKTTISQVQLLLELESLHQQISQLHKENHDLNILLENVTQHGDTLFDVLNTSIAQVEDEKLALEISLDTVTEHADFIENDLLHQIEYFINKLNHIRQEKSDLEVSLQAVSDHADVFNQGLVIAHKKLEYQVQKRTQELAEKNTLLKKEINQRKKAQEALYLSASVFEASNEGIFITNAKGIIVSINQAYTNLTGYTNKDSVGQNPSILKSGRHSENFYHDMWKAIKMVGFWSGEVWNRRKNEDVFPCWLSISAVKNDIGKTTHYISILSDNTSQRRSEARLHHLAHYDALTNLPNRSAFLTHLENSINYSKLHQQSIALLFIDLDHFKNVNDSFGHPIGDELLCQVGQRLKQCTDNHFMARLGGDEFAIIISHLPIEQESLKIIAEIVKNILQNFHSSFILGEHEVFISASMGVSVYPQDADNVSELLRNADTAAYNVKEAGRNNYQFYTEAMNIAMCKSVTLQNSLRRALERNELRVLYQPQLDTKTGQLIGVEALIRWQHPTLGLVSPAEFIPIAEDSGLIIPIGEWVLKTACEQNKAWQEAGFPPIRMAVNLSARQFYDNTLVDKIQNILSSTELAPHWLELEITESLAMTSADKTLEILNTFKKAGIHLAIDDFGTGYSSLSYLKRFTIDTLKIDASFINDLSSKNGAAIVSAIISMAHTLQLTLVAEGVEELEQLNYLREHDCDFVQGYYFYRPLAAKDMLHVLREKSGH